MRIKRVAICPVMDSLGFELYENYHSKAIQHYLSNVEEEMPRGAWDVCVCNSRESRGEKGSVVYKRTNSFSGKNWIFFKSNKTTMRRS